MDEHTTNRDEFDVERCYICGLPMELGQPSYRLRDEDGHDWVAHQPCAEKDMELANG